MDAEKAAGLDMFDGSIKRMLQNRHYLRMNFINLLLIKNI